MGKWPHTRNPQPVFPVVSPRDDGRIAFLNVYRVRAEDIAQTVAFWLAPADSRRVSRKSISGRMNPAIRAMFPSDTMAEKTKDRAMVGCQSISGVEGNRRDIQRQAEDCVQALQMILPRCQSQCGVEDQAYDWQSTIKETNVVQYLILQVCTVPTYLQPATCLCYMCTAII